MYTVPHATSNVVYISQLVRFCFLSAHLFKSVTLLTGPSCSKHR